MGCYQRILAKQARSTHLSFMCMYEEEINEAAKKKPMIFIQQTNQLSKINVHNHRARDKNKEKSHER